MADKWRVKALLDKRPALSVSEIAERLGCESAYVRATIYRNGWSFPLSREIVRPGAVAVLRELRQHITFDPEGEISREQFDAMLARADEVIERSKGPTA